QPEEVEKIIIYGKIFISEYAGKIPQHFLIKLSALWNEPKNCELCYGENSKPLYETDKSALTPAIVFNFPEPRKIKPVDRERFLKIEFENALYYAPHKRNNEHFLFSIDPEILIKENQKEVKDWLSTLKENQLFKETNQKILIVSPCHHSNSTFINLVN